MASDKVVARTFLSAVSQVSDRDLLVVWSKLSCGFRVVEFQHASQPLTALDRANAFTDSVRWHREQNDVVLREISPVRVVKATAIPLLFIHGDSDPLVPLQQSQKIVEALKTAGGSAELIVKKGGGHPWMTISEEVKIMADWFDHHLPEARAEKDRGAALGRQRRRSQS